MAATMKKGLERIAWLAVAIAVGGTLAVASCDNDPEETDEICDNGRDDNGNYAVDCQDVACIGFPGCESTPDGDADTDADADSDIDADADGGGDSGGDADAPDADVDACDPEEGPCGDRCSRDAHCALALDLRSCCGGFPHRVGGELTVCAEAVLTTVLEAEPCVIDWSAGDPLPSVPGGCEPECGGILCGSCPQPARAVCRSGECIAVAEGGCGDDSDCAEGESCVDVDLDGFRDCVEGAHECAVDEDCTAAYPGCSECSCQDFDIDGLRDCECLVCDICFSDLDCDVHEFCTDDECVYAGDDACRASIGHVDCEACFLCEARESADRGACVRDAGCTNCTLDSECDPHRYCIDNACTFAGGDACRVDLAAVDCETCQLCEPSEEDATRGTCAADPACS